MRDYQEGLTLRDIPGAVVQHSDSNLLQTVNASAKGQKQFSGQREQLLPAPVWDKAWERLGEKGCTSHSQGTITSMEWQGQGPSWVFLGGHEDFCAACDQWGCAMNCNFLDFTDKMLSRSQNVFRGGKPLRSISVFSFVVSVFCWWDLTQLFYNMLL